MCWLFGIGIVTHEWRTALPRNALYLFRSIQQERKGLHDGYFRGPSYAHFETEYRYPITRNKLISGVVFMNLQSASNNDLQHVYGAWNYGGGAGFRFLFQKKSRSAVCVDFSQGQCGSSGIFFGLNEVF